MAHKKKASVAALLLTAAVIMTACSGGVKPGIKRTGSGQSGMSTSGSGLVSASSGLVSGSSGQISGNTSGSTASGKFNGNSNNNSAIIPGTKPVNLNGYTFIIASGWMTLESDMGEHTPLFERLFYQRAHQVEKEFNCHIKVARVYAKPEILRPYIMAGKKVADVIESMPTWIPQDVALGYLKDWNSVPGINLKDSKWMPYASNLCTYKGKVYGLSYYRPPEARYCVMFNKTLLRKNGINADNIYNLVQNKQWTWDTLRQYAIACTKDTNNDGVPDTYGIVGKPDYIGNAILASFGGSLVANSGGKYKYSLTSNASRQAMSFYNKLVNQDKVTLFPSSDMSSSTYQNSSDTDYYTPFDNGKAAFLIWESWVLNQYTKASANFDYGILPLPLGGSMKNYVSPAQNARVLCLTSTNKTDLSKTVTILNALAQPMNGYQNDSAYWNDVQSDYFQKNDTKSLNMYKLILNSSMQDPGLAVSDLETAFYQKVIFDSILWKNGSTTDAAISSLNGVYDDAINSVYNK